MNTDQIISYAGMVHNYSDEELVELLVFIAHMAYEAGMPSNSMAILEAARRIDPIEFHAQAMQAGADYDANRKEFDA